MSIQVGLMFVVLAALEVICFALGMKDHVRTWLRIGRIEFFLDTGNGDRGVPRDLEKRPAPKHKG